ncbi:hypothetical protein CIHG_07585 [Coccidioides immitis H538.4]|uniref:rRNA-processing protein EFG1 n=3 Tax=Coccidioides immitis TaxID=5501 RepID=A0A0J8R458_COCIT|nr:hypothetical protein CIRG_07877 [Coccidioides immitis RMSCC 2394]KMU79526.1 hypothetical protein CISG_01944 [Coccidioides immitis RMSCC 3703]KMU89901.1 hypothetical protein CIHG_07585 [Coccidioides immitis H538.4]TPX19889.1 18S rRNA maturation protein [Coccidioides immitis]
MSLHEPEAQPSLKKRRRDSFSNADPKRVKRLHSGTQRPHYHDIGPSVNELKTRIRDVKRLLAKRIDDLPADVRVAKERELAECQRDLEKAEVKKQRSKMIQKYHFVRFLERKRATKELKRLKGQLHKLENDDRLDPNARENSIETLNRKISASEIDLNYTIYSPLTEKYISLYPNERRKQQPMEPEESNVIRTNSGEKPPLWYTVKQSMADGTLELLRDGKLGIGLSGEKKDSNNADVSLKSNTMSLLVHRKQKKPKSKIKVDGDEDAKRSSARSVQEGTRNENKRTSKEDVQGEDDDAESESDGGFFE